MKLEMAAPLRVELQAYGRQRRAALTEIHKQQRTSLRQPFLSGREFQIWLPLLLHARLIAGEGGEAGKKFESEFIDTVKGFVGAKVTMVADDDWRLAEALEVMEAV
jgi:hypothetical protein